MGLFAYMSQSTIIIMPAFNNSVAEGKKQTSGTRGGASGGGTRSEKKKKKKNSSVRLTHEYNLPLGEDTKLDLVWVDLHLSLKGKKRSSRPHATSPGADGDGTKAILRLAVMVLCAVFCFPFFCASSACTGTLDHNPPHTIHPSHELSMQRLFFSFASRLYPYLNNS